MEKRTLKSRAGERQAIHGRLQTPLITGRQESRHSSPGTRLKPLAALVVAHGLAERTAGHVVNGPSRIAGRRSLGAKLPWLQVHKLGGLPSAGGPFSPSPAPSPAD